MKKEMFTPFSNGSEAMDWVGNNCDRCVKAYRPKIEGDYPSDKTMRQYCSIGKECKLKYAIDFAFITGEIPMEIAKQIGLGEEYGLKDSCMFYSDNEDDGYNPKPKPKPDGSGPNQMVMPFSIEQSLKMKKQLV